MGFNNDSQQPFCAETNPNKTKSRCCFRTEKRPRRRMQCQVCKRWFRSKRNLQQHLDNLPIKVSSRWMNDTTCDHNATLLHYCELCGVQVIEPFHLHSCFHTKLSTRKRRLGGGSDLEMKHEQSDFSMEEEDIEECIYCNVLVPTARLNTHESWHRKFDKSVKDSLETRPLRMRKDNDGLCAYCGVMKPGNKLRRHEYVEHVKRYMKKVCDVCGIFTCPTYIKEHMRTHDAERGFKCNDCGKAFFRKKALSRHRLVHSDVARYMCTVCGKSFKIKFNLRVHMRTHDDVKPFPCSVCKKTFTTKQWRDNHLKTHGIVANK